MKIEVISRMNNPLINDELLRRGAVYFDTVDSTNIAAKRLARERARHMTMVLADEQTQGRGRRGRSWLSRAGHGAWMTIIVRPDVSPEHAPELVLVAAVALSDAITNITGMKASIKWPNDVQLNGKKISGTLLELSVSGVDLDFAVVGVGVNILGRDFPDDLPDAASLESITGAEYKRTDVVTAFWDAFVRRYDDWAAGGLPAIMPDYKKHSITIGAQVKAICPDGEHIGRAIDIAPNGALMLKLDSGEIRHLYAGDVSIRGAL